MKNLKALRIIKYLANYIENSLEEIEILKQTNGEITEFLTGQIYAFVECLEIISDFKEGERDRFLKLEKRLGIK